MSWLEWLDPPLPAIVEELDARRRKTLLVEARRGMLQRGHRTVAVYPVFLAIMGVATSVAVLHPVVFFSLLGLASVSMLVRIALARRILARPNDVRTFGAFMLLGLLSSSVMTAFAVFLMVWYGDHPVAYIGQLGVAGISAGIIAIVSIHRRLARMWVLSCVLPMVACNLWLATSLSYGMATMLGLYLVINWPVSDRVHSTYWRAQVDAALLEQRSQETARLAHWAGMAEIAASVLHDVGNVLNSVRISAQTAQERLQSEHGRELGLVVQMLRTHEGGIDAFLRDDPKGKVVLEYLDRLAEQLERERTAASGELQRLDKHLDHIATVVSRQQEYAKGGRSTEVRAIEELTRDAVDLVANDHARRGVELAVEVDGSPRALVDVHQTMQILVNLFANARDAVADMPGPHVVHVRVGHCADGRPCIAVTDRGCGIAPETAERIFTHGFTTKARGHGFGLHHSFLAAKAMGGRLDFASDGPGRGATFTLVLPEAKAERVALVAAASVRTPALA